VPVMTFARLRRMMRSSRASRCRGAPPLPVRGCAAVHRRRKGRCEAAGIGRGSCAALPFEALLSHPLHERNRRNLDQQMRRCKPRFDGCVRRRGVSSGRDALLGVVLSI